MAGRPEKIRLSVAIIVRDAAEPLRLTLASAKRLADEIIVVDTGSSDSTLDVAREFEARTLNFPWIDNFAAARNFALEHVTGDWVLWLDAGETLGENDAASLRAFVNESAHKNTAYLMLVRVPGTEPISNVEQIARLRLAPNRAGILFEGRIRESMRSSLENLGIGLDAVPFAISRSASLEQDLRTKKRRAQRNLRLAELEQHETQVTAAHWNCLAEALQTLGHGDRAESCYRHALATAQEKSHEQLEAYYGLLTVLGGPASNDVETAQVASADERRQMQIAICLQALGAFPLDAQLLCALGGYLYQQGSHDLALKAYSTAYEHGQVEPMLWHVREIQEVAGLCCAVTLRLMKRDEEAIGFLEKATSEHPDSVKLRRQLIDIYVSAGNRELALAHVGKLPKSMPHLEALRSAVRGACYAVAKNWIAAKAYLETAYGHGCREPLCLRWLSISILVGGDTEAARPIVEQWRKVEPQNEECARLWEKLSPPAAAMEQAPQVRERTIRFDTPSGNLSGTAIPLNLGVKTPEREIR